MKMDKSKNKSMNFEPIRWLIYGAAAFQAYHMGRAFHVYDPGGWHFMNVNFGGLILGAILNVIVAQTAVRLPMMSAAFVALKQLMPKVSKRADKKDELTRSRALKKMTLAMKQNIYSQVGFYTLFIFSALMVAPALFILWSETLPFWPWFIGFMSVIGAVAPDVAITVGGFALAAGLRQGATASGRRATGANGGATESGAGANRTPKKPARSEAEMRVCDLGCGMSYRWPQGKGAHMKKYHPELCVVKATPAGSVLPLNASAGKVENINKRNA